MSANDRDENGREPALGVAYAARDAVAYAEALWTGDRRRAGQLWAAASPDEREHMAEALASLALTALRTPETTPPGVAVGVWRSMLEDGVTELSQ